MSGHPLEGVGGLGKPSPHSGTYAQHSWAPSHPPRACAHAIPQGDRAYDQTAAVHPVAGDP